MNITPFRRCALFAIISSALLSEIALPQTTPPVPLNAVIQNALDFSVRQSRQMAESLRGRPGLLPRTIDASGKLVTCTPSWWTCGFFPGTLWYLYEYTGDETLKTKAKEFCLRVRDQQYVTGSHDVGFMINCSFGNGYRLTGDSTYRKVLHTAARSLLTRFSPSLGVIRSWNSDPRQWQYAVIIDNMMNLELLMWAAQEFHEPDLAAAAIAHANTTLKHHYRADYSCYHVVSYDTLTGVPHRKQTAQGYADNSAWARGQAWGLYGFTMMYRFTKDTAYLTQAEHIAAFLLHHPRLPEDKIPYWDFDAPDIPNAKRDASAGAIICSALIELSDYVSAEEAKEYLAVAEIQLRALSSLLYRSAPGENANFILKHSVGNMPRNSEVDVPLPYADYYFVEALMRMYRRLR